MKRLNREQLDYSIKECVRVFRSQVRTRSIEFKGMPRLEHSEYPVPALREILLNALAHCTYMRSFIRIRVCYDKISMWNHGTLPEGITLE